MNEKQTKGDGAKNEAADKKQRRVDGENGAATNGETVAREVAGGKKDEITDRTGRYR